MFSDANVTNNSKRIPDLPAECYDHDQSCEYQTADELFNLMAKNHQYDHNVGLSPNDLVILYRNIEMGTKLMNDTENLNLSKPNQYVETVVYNEDPDSDCTESSEVYTSEDLHNVVLFNKERIDLLSNPSSLQNTLCNKLGALEMPTSNISVHYDKHFLFKDPFIKEQLTNMNIMLKSTSDDFVGPLFPSSLLDYICCKRLDDNYDFYMDNVIKYVQHTIEQLKRISNGEYLTDRAKEKWKKSNYANDKHNDNMKILATSASIPLQGARKPKSNAWSDIIHSEVDIRSLCKTLEKKIIVEIPKIIQGSYKLLYTDNLIFSCKKGMKSKNNANESRLDVILQLGHPETGTTINNISSIMIRQSNPPILQNESTVTSLKPLPYTDSKKDQKLLKIVEIEEEKEEVVPNSENFAEYFPEIIEKCNSEVTNTFQSMECESDDDIDYNLSNIYSESSESSEIKDLGTKVVNTTQHESLLNINAFDVLAFSSPVLRMDSLPEENCEDIKKPTKSKSPTKIRVKSPYENKSFLIEEKKRKKLLEIRERREKKKMAMNENCKISKHKYAKGSIMPRPSSSVTKLSISNKSFYNSIYGQNPKDVDIQSSKCKSFKGKKDITMDNSLELGAEQATEILSPDTNNKKYIDRSYYLDDAVTEIMYTEPSEHSSDVRELFSVSTSVLSADLDPNISSIAPMANSPCEKSNEFGETTNLRDTNENKNEHLVASLRNIPNDDPSVSHKNEELEKVVSKNSIPVECRKSIGKIYGLIKKLGNPNTFEYNSSRSKSMTSETNKIEVNIVAGSSLQYSDSGTSLKHLLVSSNPSSFSFDKIPTNNQVSVLKNDINKKVNGVVNVVPKVIISTKQQTIKTEADKIRKERKKIPTNAQKVQENPLKAISQLLHEFDSVQRTRQKITTDSKSNDKPRVSFENRNISRQNVMKTRIRLEPPDIKNEQGNEKNKGLLRERKVKQNFVSEPFKIAHQPSPIEDRHVERPRKRLADILDEVKEAKGEAVRGPSKTSRLNTLAQPKKSYVQAHSEEYQTKYGRTLMTDRLQRLAAVQAPMQISERQLVSAGARGRLKRNAALVASASSQQHPSLPPLERGAKPRRSASASPEKSTVPDVPSYKHSDASTPGTLKNKMVAVESYVKSHYGRGLTANGEHVHNATKARVPLVPHDLDFSPVPSSPTGEESAAIGNKLHCIINNIMKMKPAVLTALNESPECDSKHSQEDQFDEEVYHCKGENPSSVDSENRADIFEDQNVKTAVQNFFEEKVEESVTEECSEPSNVFKCIDIKTSASTNELEQLESALHRQISVGNFPKRLRLKRLTITPKQSMEHMFLVQSGDAGSGLLMQPTKSKNLKVNISQLHNEVKLGEMQTLVRPHMNWNVTNIPLQITTVGYAFPKYESIKCGSNLNIKSCTSIVDPGLKNIAKYSHRSLLETNSMQDIHFSCCNAVFSDVEKEVSKLEPPPKEEIIVPIETTTTTNEISRICVTEEKSRAENDLIDKVKNFNIETNLEHNINYTSSLDMLVGILNEIQKITACHITSTENYGNRECMQLENLLCNDDCKIDCAVNFNKSQDLMSIASLDRLRQLDSNSSIYSLYISNDESKIDRQVSNVKISMCNDRINYVDKEVSTDFPDKQLTSTFTDVPSLFPIAITHSTYITDSLMGILSKPSNPTIFSFHDDESAATTNCREISFDLQDKLIEISSAIKNEKKQHMTMHQKIANVSKAGVIREKPIKDTFMGEVDIISYKTKSKTGPMTTKCTNLADHDSLLKMKRDILVTVYSMLVLTVFAALSFPDLLYQNA